MFFIIIKASLGKICSNTIYFYGNMFFIFNFSFCHIPYEMVVHLRMIVEKVNENLLIRNKATSHKWVTKLVIWHCKIV